jgi:D-hydroxyproline dehydrogenase subunit alpha
MSSPAFDVAVVGAGPAGLAAALAAAESGVTVALIDAGVRPGGQYWRSPAPGAGAFTPPTLHHEWRRFAATAGKLGELASTGRVALFAGHHVWFIAQAGVLWSVHCALGAEPRQGNAATRPVSIHARRVVLATGAYDRQLPFPGWDLPGVMTAGGVQSLLKGHLVVAGKTVVLAGSGPFLLPVAAGLVSHGARIPAIIEANTPLAFARFPRAVLGAAIKLGEAATYAAVLFRHRVAVRHRHAVIRAVGKDRLEGVVVARLGSDRRPLAHTERSIACDVLAVGWGFIPQLELHLQLGCSTRMDSDANLVVDVDDNQQTSVEGVWAAGESTGIGGANLASIEGELAGYAVATSLGAAPARHDGPLRKRRAALREFASAMHRVYSIPHAMLDGIDDETLVCRCEEVPAGSIRRAVEDLGATDARTVKLLARPGMGWCQGRVCGFATVCLTTRHTGRPAVDSDMRAFADRPIATPISLSRLAALTDD